MDSLIQDFRSGIRQLFRQRGSSLVAVLTLALGIGVCTAIVSVVDAALLRPLPYPDPAQLIRINPEEVQPDGTMVSPSASMADMRAWQAADDLFTAVAGWGGAFRGRIVDGPEPVRIPVVLFTEDYLPIHGVAPIIGRGFAREDCDPGAPLVALLGYGYWQSQYGGRDNVIGDLVRLDGEVATIVGVLPAWFNATTPLSMPLRIAPAEFARRGTGRVSVIARLRPDVSLAQARERLSSRMSPAPRPDGSISGRACGRRHDPLGTRRGHDASANHRDRARQRGRPDPAARVRERRGVAARARRGAPVRTCRARITWRRPPSPDAATADRKRGARTPRRRDRPAARVADARRHRRQSSAETA